MSRDVLPQNVLEALKAGNKIEAIKLLREVTGQKLRQAKDRIDSYEGGGAAAPMPELDKPAGRDANSSFTLTREAFAALKNGNKIEAIKIVRQATGVGLAEAKTMVDEIEKSIPKVAKTVGAIRHAHPPYHARPGLAPGQVPSSGGPGKWLALLAVAAVAVVAGLYLNL